jgi:magnesium and cobalt transporter
MVHIKDIIAQLGRSRLLAALGAAQAAAGGALRPVLDLLLRMRQERVHMALVVDEYGGIDGLITIEDLVETIVGDISDEHDELAAPQMTERAEGVLELDARTPVEAFEERMGQVLTEEERAADIDTVGGLVFTLAGRVPARGEIFSHSRAWSSACWTPMPAASAACACAARRRPRRTEPGGGVALSAG